MFGTQNTDLLVKSTIEELEYDSVSTTYDEVMFNFIDYITHFIMVDQDASIYDAINYMNSDEFHDELYMYIENYFCRFYGSRRSFKGLVWMNKEQLDELVKSSDR